MPENPEPTARRFLEIAPLVRAVGIASDPKKLILAAVGLLAMAAGAAALDRGFGAAGPDFAWRRPGPLIRVAEFPAPPDLAATARLMTEPALAVVLPFWASFARPDGAWSWARSALMGVWAVAVWGIAGGAIARIAVVQAAEGRGVGLGSAARFALGRAVALIAAPLTPILASMIFAAGLAGFGLLYRIPGGVGATVAAFLGFLPLLAGLVMALILLGLAAGWPLMIVTVAAEGEDAPDALSRAYSYVNQRLARYATHAAVAWGIGAVALGLVIAFARVVLGLADRGVALGMPARPVATDLSETVRGGWALLVGLLVHAWIYSYFWSAASILYLILRRDVDGAEWHDVYQPEHEADAFAGGPGAETEPREAAPEAAEAGPA